MLHKIFMWLSLSGKHHGKRNSYGELLYIHAFDMKILWFNFMHFGMWMKWSCFIWYSLNVNLNTYENNVQNIIYLQGSSTFDIHVIYNIIWLGYSYLEDIMCSIVLQYKAVVENIIRIYFWAILCKITLFDSCLLYLAKSKNTVIQSIMKEYFSTLHFMHIFLTITKLNTILQILTILCQYMYS